MKLEGVAEIELTNVHTGEKERYVEKNMVTNALQHIFGKNRYFISDYDLIKNLFLPLYEKALGGVFIFDNVIEEDPNIMVPPANVDCIGHAGDVAYSGKNERRGQINTTETTLLEDGVKLVWDFGTDKANGTIKCVGLTSSRAGNNGLGNETVYEGGGNIYEFGTIAGGFRNSDGKFLTPFDEKYGYYSYYYKETATYENVFYDVPNNTYKLTFDPQKIKVALRHKSDCGFLNGGGITESRIRDGIRYVVSRSGSSNVKGFVLTEINLQTFQSQIHDFSSLNIYCDSWEIMGGYIYVSNGKIGGDKIFKIDINNYTDIHEFKVDDYSISGMIRIGNLIALYSSPYYRYVITGEDKLLKTTFSTAGDIYDDGTYLFAVSNNSSVGFRMFVNMAYLATINNLATPVIKTADKTMKITYTIREKVE